MREIKFKGAAAGVIILFMAAIVVACFATGMWIWMLLGGAIAHILGWHKAAIGFWPGAFVVQCLWTIVVGLFKVRNA